MVNGKKRPGCTRPNVPFGTGGPALLRHSGGNPHEIWSILE